MTYRESLTIHSCDCDMYGRWKPSAIMEALQNIAGAHCESLGLGRDVTTGLGVVWVLSRCHVEMNKLPANGERIAVETWAGTPRHLFFPRMNRFVGASGEELGTATGFWLLLDIQERRAVMRQEVLDALPIADKTQAAVPRTVRPLDPDQPAERLVPAFTDFDLNGHVNNTKYLEWCWDALGFDALRDRRIASFDVNYDREIRPGEAVDTALCRSGDAFSYVASVDGARCFCALGSLAPTP